jgi:hypothetical protein
MEKMARRTGREKSRKIGRIWELEKIGEVGECLGVGELEKIENWGGKIEKFSAYRRAEWRKIETATGWRRQKIEKKSRKNRESRRKMEKIETESGGFWGLIRGFWRVWGLRACRFGSIQGAGSVDSFGARGLCITSRFGRRQFCGSFPAWLARMAGASGVPSVRLGVVGPVQGFRLLCLLDLAARFFRRQFGRGSSVAVAVQ